MEEKDCPATVEKLIEKYAWSGADYDFAACDPLKAM